MKPYILPVLAVLLLIAWIWSFCFVVGHLVIPANGKAPDGRDIFWLFSTIGALITSASIVELGVKDPHTSAPKLGIALSQDPTTIELPQKIISIAMLVAWLTVGCLSVYFSFFWDHASAENSTIWPEGQSLIQNHAKAAIGFVIAALYAYLGIKP